MKNLIMSLMTIATCIVISAQPVPAQRASDLRAGLNPPPTTVPAIDRLAIRSFIRDTYWKEGALAGIILVAVPTAIWANGYSKISAPEAVLGGILSGVIIGGPLGALIGGQFPKGGGRDAAGDPPEMGAGQVPPRDWTAPSARSR